MMKKTTRIIAISIGISALTMNPSVGSEFSDHGITVNSKATLNLRVGESFTRARAHLTKLGWKPIRMHDKNTYEYMGTEHELISRGFDEVDSCSTDAGSLCILYYKKGKACLRIDTVGEKVDQMKLTSWAAECPTTEISRVSPHKAREQR